MNDMAPHDLTLDSNYRHRKNAETEEELLILVRNQKKMKKVSEKNRKRKYRQQLEEIWENEQFIQIKGIQKTQDAMNRNLRQIQLDKRRIERNKRIEEASENIRRRRETQKQQAVLKEVLQKIQNREQLHDGGNLNKLDNELSNKENMISRKDTQSSLTEDNVNSYNKTDIPNKDYSLPPLVRTIRKKPFVLNTSVRKSENSSSFLKKQEHPEETVQFGMNNNRRSIVITIPDVNTDATPGVTTELSCTKLITKEESQSVHSDRDIPSDKESVRTENVECQTDFQFLHQTEKKKYTAKHRLEDLPPLQFTFNSFKGPPVSYVVQKDKMISYRPNYGFPPSKPTEDKSSKPNKVISPRNSSPSIPVVRNDRTKRKKALSVVGINPHQPHEDLSSPTHNTYQASRLDMKSNISPTSSRSSSPQRYRSSSFNKKTDRDSSYRSNYTNTGFVISEFSIQERIPRKQIIKMEKQPLHDFPFNVRERFIKKKLLLSQTDRQDIISWKVRKYITDPGTFTSALLPRESSPIEVKSEVGIGKTVDDFVGSVPPNKKDISDLLLRMLLKQNPRHKLQKERTVPSNDILSSIKKSSESIDDNDRHRLTDIRQTGLHGQPENRH